MMNRTRGLSLMKRLACHSNPARRGTSLHAAASGGTRRAPTMRFRSFEFRPQLCSKRCWAAVALDFRYFQARNSSMLAVFLIVRSLSHSLEKGNGSSEEPFI